MLPNTRYDCPERCVIELQLEGSLRTNFGLPGGFAMCANRFDISGVVYESAEMAQQKCPRTIDDAVRELWKVVSLSSEMAAKLQKALFEVGIECDTSKLRSNYDPTGQFRHSTSRVIKFRPV
jgi:hypothetical protein